ncbi:hypothetical protein FO519_000198 [Halicephalobus sp. NKZ332]|nr:hypothetical protein FO519_000198 [Halicephalobus sp. NKZ332]
MIRFFVFALLLSVFLIEADACGFGSLGGGCGGGCGSSCGGGCGRKKREIQIIEPETRTEQSNMCPQTEWRSVIEQNIGKDAETSKYAIQGFLYKKYETKFFVSCQSAQTGLQFAANGEGYCVHTSGDFTCIAVALIG